MSSSVSKRERKLIKCIYFYKQSPNSHHIQFAILTDDGKYAEFKFTTYCERFGTSIIRKLKKLFLQFRLDVNTDVAFSEEFKRTDGLREYFSLVRDHVQFRASTLLLKKIVRFIAWKHPRSVMMKHEIAAHKRQAKNHKSVGVERFNKIWKYLIEKKSGITCPWISKEVDYWLQTKSASDARKNKQMRLAMYYMALKNDFYGIEAMRDKRRQKVYRQRANDSTVVLFKL